MSKINIKKQIRSLYWASVFSNFSLTGAWVAILAARGFSLPQIGFAEAIFHLTSLIFEIPSGVLADVFGRKRMLMLSSVAVAVANIIMVLSNNFFLVCLSIAFNALSYNLASGSGEALAYDSLKTVDQSDKYERYLSNQMIIYRLFGGISTLCAGFALYIGYKLAYGADIIFCVLQFAVLCPLVEIKTDAQLNGHVKINQVVVAVKECYKASLKFMLKSIKVVKLMFFNSLVGACDTLLLFFIQAKFPAIRVEGLLLGVVLFVMQLGGILGSRLTVKLNKVRYLWLYFLCFTAVSAGIILEHSSLWYLMMLGGFASAMGDDALQVRTNTILQNMFPTEQRATLISIDSFIFSLIMIVLSPLAGCIFAVW